MFYPKLFLPWNENEKFEKLSNLKSSPYQVPQLNFSERGWLLVNPYDKEQKERLSKRSSIVRSLVFFYCPLSFYRAIQQFFFSNERQFNLVRPQYFSVVFVKMKSYAFTKNGLVAFKIIYLASLVPSSVIWCPRHVPDVPDDALEMPQMMPQTCPRQQLGLFSILL